MLCRRAVDGAIDAHAGGGERGAGGRGVVGTDAQFAVVGLRPVGGHTGGVDGGGAGDVEAREPGEAVRACAIAQRDGCAGDHECFIATRKPALDGEGAAGAAQGDAIAQRDCAVERLIAAAAACGGGGDVTGKRSGAGD